MEQNVEYINRLTKVETKVENIEKKVDSLDAKVEAGHSETEKDIKQLTIVLEKFIGTQTKTNENIENLVNEMKTTREKQDEKISNKIDKIEDKFNEEIKTLQEEIFKNKYEQTVENKDQDLKNANDKVHVSGKIIALIIGAITFFIGTGIAIIELIIKK